MNHWSQRGEGGNRFWLFLIRWCILNVGRGFARFWMYPTALYFFLRRGAERRASRAWLSRALGKPAGNRAVIRHIFTFAMTIVDRVLLLSQRESTLDIQAEGNTAIHDRLDQGRGCLLLGSHLGSFEAIRTLAQQAPQYKLKVVMDRDQNALITQALESLNPEIAETVIDARKPGTEVVLEVGRTLDDGHMAAMLADRAHPGQDVVQAPFMGSSAPFPTAPFMIAGITRVPVFLVFGLHEGGNRYRLVFELFAEEMQIDRKTRAEDLKGWVEQYARRLEHYAVQYPYNWFNFYDFWNPDLEITDENGAKGPGGHGPDRRVDSGTGRGRSDRSSGPARTD